MLDDFDIQASGLNDQDISITSVPSPVVTSTAGALATSASSTKSGILANLKATCTDLLWPDWPDWPDWQDINNTSSLMLPEFTDTTMTLTDHLDIDTLDESPPTTANSSSKINITDLIRVELCERPNVQWALELTNGLLQGSVIL